MRGLFLLLATGVAAASLAGCGGPDSFATSDASVWPASADGVARRSVLDGAQFKAVRATGHELLPDRVTISFAGGKIDATGGCNSTYGSYVLDDGQLSLGDDDIQTLVGCFTPGKPGSPLEDQDDWLDDFLDHAAATVRDGGRTLVLSRGAVVVTLGRQGPSGGPSQIAGRLWTAGGFEGPMRRPTLRIDNGRASIFTGCNRLAGPAQVVGQKVVFGKPKLTKGSCDPGYVTRVDAIVQRVLRGTVDYEFDRDDVSLSNGRERLDFHLPYPAPTPGGIVAALSR